MTSYTSAVHHLGWLKEWWLNKLQSDLIKRSFGGVWYPNFVKPSKLFVSSELHPLSWKIGWFLVGVARPLTTTKSANTKCGHMRNFAHEFKGPKFIKARDFMEIDEDPFMPSCRTETCGQPCGCLCTVLTSEVRTALILQGKQTKLKSLSIQKCYEMLI